MKNVLDSFTEAARLNFSSSDSVCILGVARVSMRGWKTCQCLTTQKSLWPRARALSSSEVVAQKAAIIDGKAVARRVRERVKELCEEGRAIAGRPPQLSVVLVGDRPDSTKYVELKQQAAVDCGIGTVDIRLPASVSEEDLVQTVSRLDADESIDGIAHPVPFIRPYDTYLFSKLSSTHPFHYQSMITLSTLCVIGILVQLPLPQHINQARVLSMISMSKDVDGFHPSNLGALALIGDTHRSDLMKADPSLRDEKNLPPLCLTGIDFHIPCTALACVELLDHYSISMRGKHIVVVGRSNIVGLPAALLALHRDATLTVCHQRTDDLRKRIGEADILITAAGSPELVRGDWLKPGVVVIDVGFNVVQEDGSSRICGDVHFNEALEVASHITPVPGGVGPMTIAMLMRNTFLSFLFRQKLCGKIDQEAFRRLLTPAEILER